MVVVAMYPLSLVESDCCEVTFVGRVAAVYEHGCRVVLVAEDVLRSGGDVDGGENFTLF